MVVVVEQPRNVCYLHKSQIFLWAILKGKTEHNEISIWIRYIFNVDINQNYNCKRQQQE